LLGELRVAGLHVERVEPNTPEYLGDHLVGEKRRIVVAEEVWVQIFEYTDEAAAVKDVGRVSPDGSMIRGGVDRNGLERMTMYSWLAPPHFYRRERVIALYVGSDPAILGPLERVMGPQFAGQG
jgi:hypothetical protein